MPTRISEILTDASHWCKEVQARKRNGDPCEIDNPEATAFCMLGAVNKAQILPPFNYLNFREQQIRKEMLDYLNDTAVEYAARHPQKYGRDVIHGFVQLNDHPATRFEDVVEVFKHAGVW
jgi:hypothetical protein